MARPKTSGRDCPTPLNRAATTSATANALIDLRHIGALVQWYDKVGLRFGRLIELSRKHSRVLHNGRVRRIATKELKPYAK